MQTLGLRRLIRDTQRQLVNAGAAFGLIGVAMLIAVCAVPQCVVGQQSVWLQDTPVPKPVTAPSTEEIETAIRRGVDFLLTEQNANGSWVQK